MDYPYCDKDFALAKRFVDVVLSMNEIYAERLAPSDDPIAGELFSPAPLVPIKHDRAGGTWRELRALLLEIYEGYTGIGNETRKCYMLEQILSVARLGDWALGGNDEPYVQRVADLLRVDPTPVTDGEIAADKRLLGELLGEKGYRGDLRERFDAWRKERLVAPDEMLGTLERLVSETRDRSLELGLSAIEPINVRVELARGVSYQGYCDFDKHSVYINGDLDFTYEELKALICHETFPGHMAHLQTRKTLLAQGLVPLDAALVVVCTASSPVFEGLADNAMSFIGMDGGADDRINAVYNGIKAKAALTASYLLHGEGRSGGETAAYMMETAFAGEAWAEARLRLMSYPLRKPFLPAYWRGNEAVAAVWRGLARERAPDFISYLYGHMHSANSLRKFR
ncbi:MAG: DUF885 domain-containing protein [Clostridiales Family XIII bacterium]|jgi:hypothetical protein|nr:DUF885 domain-containing protein [Clostridiales Family XIII bacterium]